METNNPTLLFDQNKEKTRVLISGNASGIADIIMKTLKFCDKEVDYILADSTSETNGNDFLLLEHKNASEAGNFHPNIVFVASENSNEDFSNLLKNIVGGGVLVYNENDENLVNAVASTENYFRKLPYTKPETKGNYIKTEIGDIPVNLNSEIINHIDGARLLCQQFGIMEEEFYESLIS